MSISKNKGVPSSSHLCWKAEEYPSTRCYSPLKADWAGLYQCTVLLYSCTQSNWLAGACAGLVSSDRTFHQCRHSEIFGMKI